MFTQNNVIVGNVLLIKVHANSFQQQIGMHLELISNPIRPTGEKMTIVVWSSLTPFPLNFCHVRITCTVKAAGWKPVYISIIILLKHI